MAHASPGKSDREGITLVELCDIFPTEESAREWFESRVWSDGRHCPRCGSTNTGEASHKKMPYWCPDCRSYFSVKVGTVLENSKISLRKWVFAIYLHLTSLKGVSSMKLHRDISVSQPCAWFMLQRIRKAWEGDDKLFAGTRRDRRDLFRRQGAEQALQEEAAGRSWHGRQGRRGGCQGS